MCRFGTLLRGVLAWVGPHCQRHAFFWRRYHRLFSRARKYALFQGDRGAEGFSSMKPVRTWVLQGALSGLLMFGFGTLAAAPARAQDRMASTTAANGSLVIAAAPQAPATELPVAPPTLSQDCRSKLIAGPTADSSSTVKARGSFSTPSPSESDTPCFLMFAASFFGSNSTDTFRIYVRYAYMSIWRQLACDRAVER